MSAQESDVPTVSAELVRRANQLCLRAEPHTDAPPCAAHLAEAQRQLPELAG